MNFKHVPIFIIFILSTILISCNGGKMSEQNISYDAIKDLPASAWKKLSQKKICFGHQSVGMNIIDGIKDLMKEYPKIKLNIIETDDISEVNTSAFAHFWVGENANPQSKLDNFTNLMIERKIDRADIAFFKFCYIDINRKTNIQEVFNKYKANISLLKKEFPKITFVHLTIPLTSKPSGVQRLIKKVKNYVKKFLGRPVFNYYDNIKRNLINEMLKKEYDGKDPIFDLAKIESTKPDGSRESFIKDGKDYYSLIEEYTNDGGHLNVLGRRKVAEQFLLLLANIS